MGEPAKKMATRTETSTPGQRSERIARLKARYQGGPAYISTERAKYYTESWRSTEGTDTPLPVRVAMAHKNVFEKMTHYLDPDDRIAGYWTEYFVGAPISIELGVYNRVLAAELTLRDMIKHRAINFSKSLTYMVKKGVIGEFLKYQRITRATGAMPLNMGFQTMQHRPINNYQIDPESLSLLRGDLLPYWRGRCLIDILEKGLADSGLLSTYMSEFISAATGNTSRQMLLMSVSSSITSFQGHLILDYTDVLERGLEAKLNDVKEMIKKEGLDQQQKDFLESVRISIEGVIAFADGIAGRIEKELDAKPEAGRREELENMLNICRKTPRQAPETFREAIQAMWTVKTAAELAMPMNLHCVGRLDQQLYPFYKADIEAGRTTPDEARELLSELLLKLMSQNIRLESNILGNFYHRFLGSAPVTVGGLAPDGSDATNELTYLFIEASHNSKAVCNLSVRIHKDSPPELLDLIGRCLHEGTSTYSLYNDDVNVDAMRRRGCSEEDALDYAIIGCVELTCPGKTGAMTGSALSLASLLDVTMRNGDGAVLLGKIRDQGLKTGAPDSFENFDRFVDALIEQGSYFIKQIVDGQNLRDRIYEQRLPVPIYSAFLDGCLESKKDVTQGGAKYDLAAISMVNSIANLIDSLLVIKKLVYEQKKFTIKQLLTAVDDNFEGHVDILREINKVKGKWGNGDPETDDLARDVMKRLFEETNKHKNYRGGPFMVISITMTSHTIMGRVGIATPDGRHAATPYAASCSPYNVECCGTTATLRSVAALPFEDVLGAAVNIRFHPTAIGRSEQSRKKWASLVRAYFELGGQQIQPTVASAEQMREAQKDPHSYRDLIVKVGGYSTYFVDLGREIQEEVISRTEHQ